jgi:hypothetical protein
MHAIWNNSPAAPSGGALVVLGTDLEELNVAEK